MRKFLCLCGGLFVLSSECMQEQHQLNLRRDYNLYTQEMGYVDWYRDMEELFGDLERLRVDGVNRIENQHTNLDDLLTVTTQSALFSICWDPALEQKGACNLVKDIKNRILDRYGPNDPDMKVVLDRLDGILSFEEEDSNGE